jgi:hypothetical protein
MTTLYDDIIAVLPELAEKPEEFTIGGSIRLQDDSDELGAYISKWDYSKPIPKGMKLGK